MRKSEIVALVIIAVSFALGWYLYPEFPIRVAVHWNAAGQVDSYWPRLLGIFFMPLVSLIMYPLLVFLPRAGPLRKNLDKFRDFLDDFIVLLYLFLFYVFFLSLAWNLGIRFSMSGALIPAVAVILYACSVLIENAKQNWFIGIRTPWTLSSEAVWDRTHQRGAVLFRISAGIALLGLFAGAYALWFVLAPIFSSSAYLFVYSYLEYKREEESKAGRMARVSSRSR